MADPEEKNQETDSEQLASSPGPDESGAKPSKPPKKLGSKGSEKKASSTAKSKKSPAKEKSANMPQHHVSKILDEVLDEPEEEQKLGGIKHPMWLDVVLAIGLLFTVGGFTVGLFKIYITHTADQAITQHNYKAAIAILKGAPFPGFFTIPGSDPDELLSQALYLDGMDKLEVENDVDAAMNEFQQIPPGSRFFQLAQEIITDNANAEASSTLLEGGTSMTEEAAKGPTEKKPILPELKDASP